MCNILNPENYEVYRSGRQTTIRCKNCGDKASLPKTDLWERNALAELHSCSEVADPESQDTPLCIACDLENEAPYSNTYRHTCQAASC